MVLSGLDLNRIFAMTRLSAALCCLLLANSAMAATATIATAANFKLTMTELISQFQSQQPHHLRQVNASSGVLFNQISHGAPFDVFLAANSRYPTALAEQGYADSNSLFTYAEGKLVLASTTPLDNSPARRQPNIADLLSQALQAGKKIAIANPETAPYGIAARQALQHLNLWQHHQPQLVRGNNAAQSVQFVATGNVSFGLVALSQAQNPLIGLFYWPIPATWYQPIRQQAILLQSAQHNPAATAFLDFLKSREAKAIIRRHGYNTP